MGSMIIVLFLIAASVAAFYFVRSLVTKNNVKYEAMIASETDARDKAYYRSELISTKIPSYVLGGGLSLAAFVFLMNAIIVVDTGTVRTPTLFGEVLGTEYTEGPHLINPMYELSTFDTKAQELTIENIAVPSQDRLKSTMDVTIIWNVMRGTTPAILQDTGNQAALISKYLIPNVRSYLRETGKTVLQSQDFFTESVQKEMSEFMMTSLNNALNGVGIEVTNVLFRDINLPPVVLQNITNTKVRQEQIEQERAELAKAEQVALKQVKEAEAREKAAVADANAKRTQADAEAYRIATEAAAQAKANRELARSLSPDLIEYNKANRWDGVLPQTVLGNQGVMMNMTNK